jgi:PPE-repeat protein
MDQLLKLKNITLILLTSVTLSACQVWVGAKTVTFDNAPVEGTFQGDWNTVLNQLIGYLQTQGQVKKIQANPNQGLVELWIEGSKVNVTMDKTTTEEMHIAVSAEKNGVPKIEVAQRVYDDLDKKLKSGF